VKSSHAWQTNFIEESLNSFVPNFYEAKNSSNSSKGQLFFSNFTFIILLNIVIPLTVLYM